MSAAYMKTASEAYDVGEYVFRAPPVPHNRWSREDWMNYVTFTVPISDGHEIHSDNEGAVWYRRNHS